MAVPPTNDVDVFAHDLGYIAIVNESGELAGFNLTVGGGMGSHIRKQEDVPEHGEHSRLHNAGSS
jgi:sulfite reductase (NADPH) hemoprotein beta-component